MRLSAAVAAGLLLLVAGAADAKLPGPGLRFCGPSACRTISDVDRMSALGLVLAGSDRPTARPAIPSPFYTVAWAGGSDWPIAYYVPGAALVRVEQLERVEWLPVPENMFDEAVRDIAAFPIPRVVRVRVGTRRAHDPASYLGLYGLLARGERVPDPLGPRPALEWRNYKALVRYYERDRRLWIPIRLGTSIPSPWSDGATQLSIGRRQDLLRGDGTVVQIPPTLARRIRKGGP